MNGFKIHSLEFSMGKLNFMIKNVLTESEKEDLFIDLFKIRRMFEIIQSAFCKFDGGDEITDEVYLLFADLASYCHRNEEHTRDLYNMLEEEIEDKFRLIKLKLLCICMLEKSKKITDCLQKETQKFYKKLLDILIKY